MIIIISKMNTTCTIIIMEILRAMPTITQTVTITMTIITMEMIDIVDVDLFSCMMEAARELCAQDIKF